MLGRPAAYAGGDTAAFERTLRGSAPPWMAYDMRIMAERFQSDGMLPGAGDAGRLTRMLGRPLRSCRDFTQQEVAAAQKTTA